MNKRFEERKQFLADLINEVAEYLDEAGLEKIWREELVNAAEAMGVTISEEELDDMRLGRFITDAKSEDFDDIPYCSGCGYYAVDTCAYSGIEDCKKNNE